MTATVRDWVTQIANGSLTSEKLVQSCLDCIDTTEPQIHAWQHLNKEALLSDARRMDDIRRQGYAVGAMHGIPVGIKDIINTVDQPTEYGSAIYQRNQPTANATVINKLKEAGAVIMGKTVTTEFAYMHPSRTTNPHNPARTPGGSSSGSAAAVAAGHVPLALGSQTNGSVIRPASFCGVYGFKPSRGIVSRQGVLQTSQHLDHVGGFARDIGDLALLCDRIAGYDPADPACYLAPKPSMLQGYLAEVPVEPALVWIDLDYAERFGKDTVEGFEELLEALGSHVERIPAPQSFSALPKVHKIIYDYEIYRCLTTEREHHHDKLSTTAQAAMEHAKQWTETQYLEALDIRQAANEWFDKFFHDYDAIVTPSATGEAPAIEQGTGDPICCTLWTLCGLPSLTMPLLNGSNNLPIGVQLVGARNHDDRLFRTARWVLQQLREEPQHAT
jgi:Asp-tRNA(Asn)/Glu-tRNA(Gln) amidotransferase A subunit family amidase